jgi:hypothetical protein
MDEFSVGSHANPQGARSLHIGLIVDSVNVSQYVYDFARWALSHQNITVTPIILNVRPLTEPTSKYADFPERTIRRANQGGLYPAISNLAFSILESYERKKIKRDKYHYDHVRKFALSSLGRETLTINPIIPGSESEDVYRFDTRDIQKIKDLNLDLFLSYECWNLSSEILSVSKLGLIRLRHGDDRKTRGGPVGFWEVYFQQDTTGFTIRRLTEDRNAGEVLMRGRFATRHYYLLNQAFIFRKSNYYLKLVIEKISTGQPLDSLPKFPYSQKLFCAPTIREIGVYAAKRFFISLMKRLRRLLKIENRWNVAFVHRDWRDAEFCRATKLKRRPFHSLADPFVISRNGRNYCFVEDLDHLKGRGTIAVYELRDGDSKFVGTVLDEEFHLSFPYLFEFRGELYMCPESSANKDIRIYKCMEFPLQWKLEKIVMKNISAADTMFFEKDGNWWMVTNIDPAGIGDHCSELFLFSASSPFDDEWKSHPDNPVVVDASCARNAGCFVDNGQYFRFSQGQGFEFYGKRLLINEIVELTSANYRESCLSVLTPSFGDGVIGIHHMHSNGRITVFDFAVRSRINSGDEPASTVSSISAAAKDQNTV